MSDALKRDLVTAGYELRETHISWVFLGAQRVYKVKKPVSLGFLDFSTVERRRQACQAEIDLNRRLAPDVYLGLRPIHRDPQGTHRLDACGPVVEWAVEMVRLPDDASAEALLGREGLGVDEVARIAQSLAAFHAGCRSDAETARYGTPALIEHNVRENFEQVGVPAYLSDTRLQAIAAYQLGVLAEQEHVFAQRAAAGRVRDGHGDLRLEHVYFVQDKLQIIDCIEFNDRFRYADVCADLAFLCMDLAFHERPDLAELLLALYAAEAQDFGLYSLVDFYMSYRAYVRAKVTHMLLQSPQPSEVAERLQQTARKYFLLAEAAGRAPLRQPRLVVVFGKIAAGKSTLARLLGQQLPAPVLSSDRTRKELAGVEPEQSLSSAPFVGAYDESHTERVYATLVERARTVLKAQRPVIVDATCSRREQRARFRELAAALQVPLLMVECEIPEALCRRRLAERAKGPSESDADEGLLERFTKAYEVPAELDEDQWMHVDTQRIDETLVGRILQRATGSTAGAR